MPELGGRNSAGTDVRTACRRPTKPTFREQKKKKTMRSKIEFGWWLG
jgi:hypothetical protein